MAKQEQYVHDPSRYSTVDGTLYNKAVIEVLDDLKTLPVQKGDVFINTYPKAGTTWMSEIVWQVFFDGKTDERKMHLRIPYLEYAKDDYNCSTKEELDKFYVESPFPRVFKLHLPYHRMPLGDRKIKPKFIYVIRTPKDVAVSYYFHYKGLGTYKFNRSWDEFFEMFFEGKVVDGSWFDHVIGWWGHRDDPNILFLKYEDMKKNLFGAVEKVAKFLGKELSTEVIERIANQTTFRSMSEKNVTYIPASATTQGTNMKFLRKGEVGDWRNYFTDEQNRRFDDLYEKKMAGTGLKLQFD